jgi:hypothetical protein
LRISLSISRTRVRRRNSTNSRRSARHLDTGIAKRIDVAAAALHHGATVDQLNDLDLSYTPPLGSPWDPLQLAAQAWTAERKEMRMFGPLPPSA